MPSIRDMLKYLSAKCSRRLRHLKEERDDVCINCPDDMSFYKPYHKGLTRKVTVGLFCGDCHCPAWGESDIFGNKNIYEKMSCPRGHWPGDRNRKDAITLHDATELVQVRDRAELAAGLALRVLDGGITLNNRIRAELGIPSPEQREAQQKAAAASPRKGCQGPGCGDGSRAPAPPDPGAVPADKFKQAFPDHGQPNGGGRRKIVANRSDDRYGSQGGQPQQVVSPAVEPYVETARAGRLNRRSIWEPAIAAATPPGAATEPAETNAPARTTAVVIVPEPTHKEVDNG